MTRTYIEESADALRRRADALLDEMMLGAVDIGAGNDALSALDGMLDAGYVNGFADHGAQHAATDAAWPAHINGEPKPPDDVAHRAAVHSPEVHSLEDATPPPTLQPGARPSSWHSGASPQQIDAQAWGLGNADQTTAADMRTGVAPNRSGQLIPAEQRYARPSIAESVPAAPMLDDSPTRSPYAAVRRQSTSLASSMTVGARASARSTLLPREAETDADTASQEIQALLSEIAASMPVGHEAAERGRHLLNKAQHILDSDPSRSAEVDYYLQQVRRIVQRTRQMHNDSSLYRRRLTIYLLAWVALAITTLAARYLLQAELLAFLEELFWTGSDSLFVQSAPMVIGAFFGGALGAATGVLANMQRHAAQEYGYFDRKYGLRGLLLPLLGAVFGLVLAAIWAAVCYFAGWDATNLWIGSLPAIVALVLGFAQERIYGAR